MDQPPPSDLAAQLLAIGYCLIALPTDDADPEHHPAFLRALFLDYLKSIPEYKHQGPMPHGQYSPGSFGAINLASAYHCPAAVHTDLAADLVVRPILKALAGLVGAGFKYLSQIPDRMCFRVCRQNPESYHTDNTAGANHPSDIFIGGSVNLGTGPQYFTLVPKTHKCGARMAGGDYTPHGSAAGWKAREKRILIPPGHVLLYFENIVHRISGGKHRGHPWLRKFVAWHLSKSHQQWCPDNEARMNDQAPLKHKGGKLAPTFPKLWLVNFPDKLQAYCAKCIPMMRDPLGHTYQSGKKAGTTVQIPRKIPPSLKALKLPLYPQSAKARKRFRPEPIQSTQPAPAPNPPNPKRRKGGSRDDPIVLD